MPEISLGPRPVEVDQNSNHIILALHSIPDLGIGGNGLSTLAKAYARCLMGDESKLIRSGAQFRQYYKDIILTPNKRYTDKGFNKWRNDLGKLYPDQLNLLDKQIDRNTAQRVNEVAQSRPLTIVDSKILSWLQILGKKGLDIPMITQATLLSVGIMADEATSTQRSYNRELENTSDPTNLENTQQERIDRLNADIHNYNQVLYPEGKQLGLPYNSTTMKKISHFIIDNSAPANQAEIEKFVFSSIQFIAEKIPSLSPTLLNALCFDDLNVNA